MICVGVYRDLVVSALEVSRVHWESAMYVKSFCFFSADVSFHFLIFTDALPLITYMRGLECTRALGGTMENF